MRPTLAILALAALPACANGVKQKMSDNLPTCASLAECAAHDGRRVHVVGVYTLVKLGAGGKLESDEDLPVRIELTDGPGPFVAAFWHADAVRPPAEKARFKGKRVRVTGTFLGKMPPAPDPDMAQMGGPCVHPVEKIEPAD